MSDPLRRNEVTKYSLYTYIFSFWFKSAINNKQTKINRFDQIREIFLLLLSRLSSTQWTSCNTMWWKNLSCFDSNIAIYLLVQKYIKGFVWISLIELLQNSSQYLQILNYTSQKISLLMGVEWVGYFRTRGREGLLNPLER